jgi:hypothetical protein
MRNKNKQQKKPAAGFVTCWSAPVSKPKEIGNQIQGLSHLIRKNAGKHTLLVIIIVIDS